MDLDYNLTKECNVCLDKKNVRKCNTCSFVLCKQCLIKSFKKSNKCPGCRQDFIKRTNKNKCSEFILKKKVYKKIPGCTSGWSGCEPDPNADFIFLNSNDYDELQIYISNGVIQNNAFISRMENMNVI